MKTNIPIYRAKNIDNNEYVKGYYYTNEDEVHQLIHVNQFGGIHFENIDHSTLAMHFHDMIDSEGTKIFASLGGDGNGGDKCLYSNSKHHNVTYTCKYVDNIPYFIDNNGRFSGTMTKETCLKFKAIGVQE